MRDNTAHTLDIRFLPDTVVMWFLSALILLPLAAAVAEMTKCGETGLAYISSALSFITALIAGAKAIRTRNKSAVISSVISSLAIIIIALTLGFVIAGDRLQADGILSLVTFTFSGALVGCVFFSGGKNRTKRSFTAKPGRRKR